MKKSKFVMFGDNCLVIALTDTQSGTLLVPDKVREKEKPVMGKVIEIGPEYLTDQVKAAFGTILVGDVLVFPDYAGIKMKIAGMTAYCLSLKDIKGKVIDFEDEPVMKVVEKK